MNRLVHCKRGGQTKH